MSTCRECQDEIIWIKTTGGRNMPCNPKPVPYWVYQHGKDRIITRHGDVIACKLEGDLRYSDGTGYIPHWATCPVADHFRRKVEKNDG